MTFDRGEAILVRNKAFDFLKKDEDLWKSWNEAKTEYERELIMTGVIFNMSFEKGFNRGWDAGREDARIYGFDELDI